MAKYILASLSPRRKEILSMLGIDFDVIPANIDESINNDCDLKDEIKRLALAKANYVFENHQDKIVIGADTIVVVEGRVLGKPKDKDEAIAMLKKLENNVHEVITGVAVVSKDHIENFVSVSKVYFNEMTLVEIENYVDTNEPMDKAGAYGIQGIGGRFIKKIDGDFYSIMGLPLNDVYQALKKYN